MEGKTCLVTGASNGIGLETAAGLAKLGATVVMTSRDKAKGEASLSDVIARSRNEKVDLMLVDFASMKSIRNFADAFKSRYDRLEVLVNNAGAVNMSRSETEDGFETTFGVNHLGYFLLTNLLLDTIKASAPSRIVNVSSRGHLRAKMDFDDLNSERNYGGFDAYTKSKLANVLFTYELARRLERTGVTANCLHPGVVRSGFGQNANNGWLRGIFKTFYTIGLPFTKSNAQGAATSIDLASSPEVEGVTGKYFADCREARSSPASHDLEAQRRLWELSEQMTGIAAAA
jgi:NAD(P)-dependent dehydrogenase (short-subunit alcohol dehydrogenase family)